VLGTLIMPYCSGISNLVFAVVLGLNEGEGQLVLDNCLVNNVTNLTLLIGLPTLFWGMIIVPKDLGAEKGKKKAKAKKGGGLETQRLNRLSLLFTLLAGLIFSSMVWFMVGFEKKGKIDTGDGCVLIAVFLLWQIFHIHDVLKYNIQNKSQIGLGVWLNLLMIAVCGFGIYTSVDWLVEWFAIQGADRFGNIGLGWLSGWFMVIPNAFLAFYYTARKRADIAYSSQVGDGHICIPLCLGLCALFTPIPVTPAFTVGIALIMGSTLLHMFFVVFWGGLPRFFGLLLTLAYGYFIYAGLIS